MSRDSGSAKARSTLSIFRRSERTPPPVKVAWAANISEAEMIEGILGDEGIPCLIKRNGGFDVPDMLAAGPRDVFVPASAAERATEILADLQDESDLLPGT